MSSPGYYDEMNRGIGNKDCMDEERFLTPQLLAALA